MEKKPPELFCEKCGAKCLVREESAEGWGPEFTMYYTYPRFNEKTGEPNLMWVLECPNFRKRNFFFSGEFDNGHTRAGRKKNF